MVRNLCAHHSRLWNRRFVITLIIPKHPKGLSVYFNAVAPRSLYNTLVLIRYELAIISPGSQWEERLIELLREHPAANPAAIGFPINWQAMDFWHDSRWELPE